MGHRKVSAVLAGALAVLSRVTSIYSRTGGKWRRVCTHVSAVPPAK